MAKQVDGDTFSRMFEFGRLIRCRMQSYPGPTLPQLETLHFISEKKEVSMRELAAHLRIKAPSATALADDLVESGLISRSADAADRRVVTLALTKRGSQALARSVARRRRVIEDVLAPLSAKDRESLRAILKKIVAGNR